MFLKPIKNVITWLEERTREFGKGCARVFVAGSGGVDSTVVITLLCRTFGPENTFVLYRNIKSDKKHEKDIRELQAVLGFKLVYIDADKMYDEFLAQCKKQFRELGEPWHDENTPEAEEHGWTNAYASLKSRFTTPLAGFISKAVDEGRGRIFGTGNAEEDELLRYFDKYGDGAVDNNILSGLTKMEVRQIALFFAKEYKAEVFKRIAAKTPSADLMAKGDEHNDESELTQWAHKMGFKNLQVSYGDLKREGNIAWALREDLDRGVIAGAESSLGADMLIKRYSYTKEQTETILFLRKAEKSSRHKVNGPYGLPRKVLREQGFVD